MLTLNAVNILLILAPGFHVWTKRSIFYILSAFVSDFGLWHWQCPRSMFLICSSLLVLAFLWVPLCCSALWDMGGLSSTSSCIVLHLPRICICNWQIQRDVTAPEYPIFLVAFYLDFFALLTKQWSFQWDRLKQSLCCSNFDLIVYQDFLMTLSTCLLAFSSTSTFIKGAS